MNPTEPTSSAPAIETVEELREAIEALPLTKPDPQDYYCHAETARSAEESLRSEILALVARFRPAVGGETKLRDAASLELMQALQDVVSDLSYQIASKHGRTAASEYPSIVAARAALSASPPSPREGDGWISVEDERRLPEIGELVLVVGRQGHRATAQRALSCFGGWFWHGDSAPEITHWRPLPAPPSAPAAEGTAR